jgi:hypothetical protein
MEPAVVVQLREYLAIDIPVVIAKELFHARVQRDLAVVNLPLQARPMLDPVDLVSLLAGQRFAPE